MEGIKEIFGLGSTAGGASQVNVTPVTEQVQPEPTPEPTPNPDEGEAPDPAA